MRTLSIFLIKILSVASVICNDKRSTQSDKKSFWLSRNYPRPIFYGSTINSNCNCNDTVLWWHPPSQFTVSSYTMVLNCEEWQPSASHQQQFCWELWQLLNAREFYCKLKMKKKIKKYIGTLHLLWRQFCIWNIIYNLYNLYSSSMISKCLFKRKSRENHNTRLRNEETRFDSNFIQIHHQIKPNIVLMSHWF